MIKALNILLISQKFFSNFQKILEVFNAKEILKIEFKSMFTIEINEKLIELESASIFRETRTEIF